MSLNNPEPAINVEDTQPNTISKATQINKNREPGYRPRFWTATAIFSLVINVILVVVVIVLLTQVFAIKSAIQEGLIDPLYKNFVLMDEARIQTTVTVETNVPARFDLPLDTDTTVRLNQDTPIDNANVSIITGTISLNAPADILLPAGTDLPIHLSLSVPVDQQIPVSLTVPVDIPLSQTELHAPFVGLRDTVAPYRDMLNKIPSSWKEALCGPNPSAFCSAILP
ncbi:hypothetical protein FDZ73_20890 [bacterium]|nr:MAG: hypothetical protein FDZ73_20890 [bacterium]